MKRAAARETGLRTESPDRGSPSRNVSTANEAPLVIRHSSFAIHSLLFLFLALGNAPAQLDHSLPLAEQGPAGQAIAEKWRDAAPAENAEYKGALKIRNPDGDLETVPLTFKIIAGQSVWQAIYESRATPKTPAQKLVIIHTLGKPNEYLLAQAAKPGEPVGQPIPFTNDQATVAFAGSDFWLIDLGLEFFHWPTQRLIRT